MPNAVTRFTLEGEKEYKQALSNMNSGLRVLGSEMKLVQSQFANNKNSIEALTKKNDVLQRTILSQKDVVDLLKNALKASAVAYGESDKRTQQWQIKLNNAETALNDMNNELAENKKKMTETTTATKKADESLTGLGDVIGQASSKLGINLPSGATKAINSLGGVSAASVATVAASAALVAALVAVEKKLIDMTNEAAAYADGILTMSQQTGLATDTLQKFSYSAELIDVSVDTVQGSLAKLTRNMGTARKGTGDAADSFKKLRIEITNSDGTLRNAEEVFYEAVDALGQIEDYTERDATAMAIFGKSAQDLNPLIVQGSEKLRELGNEAQKTGYVLSTDALNALGAVDDATQRYNNTVTAVKNNLAVEFAPTQEKVLGQLTKLISDGGQALKDSGLVDAFAMLLQSATDIIAPSDELATDTVPRLTQALRPLAQVVAMIADTLDFISGILSLDFDKAWQAMGGNYSKGFGNNQQRLQDTWIQTDTNLATKANGYGSYYANGKYYGNMDSYYQDLWKEEGSGYSFDAWKNMKGYNASGTPNWRGGRTLVGENGPELVSLPRGSSIATAQETRSMGGDTFYITIPAKDIKELNDIVRIADEQRLRGRMGGKS